MLRSKRDCLRRVQSSDIGLGIELKTNGDFCHGRKDVRSIGVVRNVCSVRQANDMQRADAASLIEKTCEVHRYKSCPIGTASGVS